MEKKTVGKGNANGWLNENPYYKAPKHVRRTHSTDFHFSKLSSFIRVIHPGMHKERMKGKKAR